MTDDNHDSRTGRNLAPETLAAQALERIDEVTRALVRPVHPSTTYERDPDGGYSSGRGYTRPHNPTYDEPEELLATLEGGRRVPARGGSLCETCVAIPSNACVHGGPAMLTVLFGAGP